MRTNAWLTAEQPLIIAHRGASKDKVENTLAAFALAIEQGADGIELDVQLSADGRPVVFHDFYLQRLAGVEKQVSALPVSELKAFDLGDGQRIPTLDEVFALPGPRILYNVEIKNAALRDDRLELAVADAVESFGLQNRVLISSFNPMAVRRSRRIFGGSVPVAHIRVKSLFGIQHLLSGATADHPQYSMVNEIYMNWAKKRNVRVHVWTVDDPQEIQRLLQLGVHGIITNVPRIARQQVSTNRHYLGQSVPALLNYREE